MNEEFEVKNEEVETIGTEVSTVESEGNNALAIAGVVGGVVTVGYLAYRFAVKPIVKKVKTFKQKRQDKKDNCTTVDATEVKEKETEAEVTEDVKK